MTESRCRGCDTALDVRTHQTATLERCTVCGGVRVEMRHLVPLLDAVTKEMRKQMDLNQIIEPVDDPKQHDPCPRCGKAMESFGYMGTKLAWPQRCGPCSSIWIDAEQMGALCLVYARTTVRRNEAQQYARDEAEGADRRTRMMSAGRKAGDLIAGGLFLGA